MRSKSAYPGEADDPSTEPGRARRVVSLVRRTAGRITGPRLLVGASVLCVLATLARLPAAYANETGVNHSAGVWVSLATDLAQHGVFYRPLIGDLGYGGTRYFPLHFVLHALLIKVFGHPIGTGFVIAAASTAALLAGAYVFLRRLGVEKTLAACATALVLSSMATQVGLTTIRSDMLAAALCVWGLASVFAPRGPAGPRLSALTLASVFFVLAFAAKPTSAFGIATSFVVLFREGHRRRAAGLVAASAIGCASVLALTYLASHGRALASFRACMLAGAGTNDLVETPLRLLNSGAWCDVVAWTILGFVIIRLHDLPPDTWRSPPMIGFLVTLAATAVMFTTPGVWLNHLVDLHVAALVLVAWVATRGALHMRTAQHALALLGAVGAINCLRHSRAWDSIPQAEHVRVALAHIPQEGGPLLSETPIVPIANGEASYMLDAFSFRVVAAHQPEVESDIRAKLRRREFRAVVLTFADPLSGVRGSWARDVHFGQNVVEEVFANYTPTFQVGTPLAGNAFGHYAPIVVYVPKPGGPQPEPYVTRPIDVVLRGSVLGVARLPGVVERGFLNTEVSDNKYFRWTNGDASLTVPILGTRPTSLAVSIRAAGPTGEMSIRVDGTEVFNDVVKPPWRQSFAIPPGNDATAIRIDIASPGWSPSANSPSTDTRTLGVCIDSIVLR